MLYRGHPLFSARTVAVVVSVLALSAAWLLSGVVSVSPADAAPAAWWHLESYATPTNLPPGGEGQIVVTASNLGDEAVNAATNTVTIVDKLPAGLETSATGISGEVIGEPGANIGTVTCSLASLSCTFSQTLKPYHGLKVTITMKAVAPGAPSGEENEVTIAGGGVPPASLRRPLTVSGAPTPFGVENYELTPENESGSLDTQAGSHPFQLTTTIALNRTGEISKAAGQEGFVPQEAGLAKDLDLKWPAGLIGNPNRTVLPQCSARQFANIETESFNGCPPDTAVGVASVTINEPLTLGVQTFTVPLFTLEPEVGEPARFGFEIQGALAFIDTSLRTGGDYGITVSANDITQLIGFLSAQVTVWGVPGDPSHDQDRGWLCLYPESAAARAEGGCTPLGQSKPPPFLTLPTSCPTNPLTGAPEPLRTEIESDSWGEPRPVGERLVLPGAPMVALDGCNQLQFKPEIKAVPDGQQASKPSGLTVDVHVPQEGQLNGAGLANSNIKDIEVTLPEGVTLNPAGADGLEACSEGLVGYLPGESSPPSELHFTSKLPVPLEQGMNFCPNASKIGTAKIKTPLLPNPLEGAVYLASQNANPFGSLVAMYVVAEDPVSGALVKLPGEVSLNPVTGQIVATFENTPQLAFEDAELHFFGGERAPLSTPAHCGIYTTNATFTPWSGNGAVSSQSSFAITSGPGGGPCPGSSLPFAPSLTAGTTNIQAGAYSTLDTTLGREDGNQNLQAVQLHMPPGFTGLLSSVKLCGEPQANAGTCGPESLIGHTTVSVGLGGDPFTVTGGEVFVTGPYNGQGACTVGTPGCAPFGLSIVNPAVAGPFNLGKVIVRAKIEVDPHTAALTITTDNSGPHKIPPILDGVPLQIKHVAVTIDKPGFTINPTNCNPTAITGTLTSTEGASAALNVPFQVTNCGTLAFAPKFVVSTSGKTSKANGASLTAKLSYPTEPQGTQADIAKVKVDLPKQLPSRLTTLQKACTNAQFEANPAACPTASKIGYATVTTPLLPVPLTGPAIFVSHGGEAFPSLTLVLQGYGVTVDLAGSTFISKAGITSTSFNAVPDTPFNTFELTLPQGKFSALAANVPSSAHYSLCGQKLTMPNEFVGQNGAVIKQSTTISITGCGKTKAKALTRAQKLTKALKVCKKDKKKSKRATCEKAAHKKVRHEGSKKHKVKK